MELYQLVPSSSEHTSLLAVSFNTVFVREPFLLKKKVPL